MLLIPAIDLKDGQCVRLQQGDMNLATVFSPQPERMVDHWLAQGAQRLHLVDLNGAFAGKPKNLSAIKAILAEVDDEIPVQLGGGVRDLDTVELLLDIGLSYLIIGTAAVKNPGFLRDACSAFPGQIMVGLDARDGKVATDGWSKLTGHDAIDMAKRFEDWGVEGIIYTDIGRDGMMGGFNAPATQALAQAVSIPIFASGGVASDADLDALLTIADDGVEGVILGRALYEGKINLQQWQSTVDKHLAHRATAPKQT